MHWFNWDDIALEEEEDAQFVEPCIAQLRPNLVCEGKNSGSIKN